MIIPDHKFDPWKDAFAGWMLLSYGKEVTVSSEAEPGSGAKNPPAEGETITPTETPSATTAPSTGEAAASGDDVTDDDSQYWWSGDGE